MVLIRGYQMGDFLSMNEPCSCRLLIAMDFYPVGSCCGVDEDFSLCLH